MAIMVKVGVDLKETLSSNRIRQWFPKPFIGSSSLSRVTNMEQQHYYLDIIDARNELEILLDARAELMKCWPTTTGGIQLYLRIIKRLREASAIQYKKLGMEGISNV